MKHLLLLLGLWLLPTVAVAQEETPQGLLIDWHPSGTMMAYSRYYSYEVIVLDVNTNEVVNTFVTSDPLFDAPQWSPDGSLLTFLASLHSIAVWSNAWDPDFANQAYYLDMLDRLQLERASPISGFAWHPSGTLLAHSVSSTIFVWDLATDEYRHLPRSNYISNIADLQWFDEDTILLGDTSPRAALVNVASGSIEATLYLIDAVAIQAVSAVAPSPDRTRVALVSTLGRLEIWDPTQGTYYEEVGLQSLQSERFTAVSTNRMNSLEWNPTGEYIAMADQDGLIRVWEAETLELVQQYNGLPNGSVAWSPDGTQLAFSTADGGLRFENIATAPVSKLLETPMLIDWHPSGTMIAYAIAESNEVVILDAVSQTVMTTIATTRPQHTAPRWSPDGNLLAFSEGRTTITVWSVEQASLAYTLDVDEGEFFVAFDWHPSEMKIALAGGTSIRIWDLLSAEVITVPGSEQRLRIQAMIWFDPQTLLIGGEGSQALLIHRASGQTIASYRVEDPFDVPYLSAVAASPDRSLVALTSDLTRMHIWYWNPSTWGETQVEFVSRHYVYSIDWSARGDVIAIADQAGYVTVWNAATLELVQQYNQGLQRISNNSAVWSPDGTQLAFSTANGLQIVDAPPLGPLPAPPAQGVG